jgi:hypothetical protein
VRIELVREKGDKVVERWVKEKVEPNSVQKVAWNGKGRGKTATRKFCKFIYSIFQ